MSWREKYSEQLTLRNEAFYSFTDRLLTLATGALALSITFQKSFSAPKPVHLELLKLSWISFTVTIIACLLVYYGKVTFYRNLASGMREAERTGSDTALGRPSRWFRPAAWLMVISFGVGIVTLACFAILNLG